MLLLIDAGNTRIKWALAAPGAALGSWTLLDVVSHAGLDGAASVWREAGVARAIVSNVAGPAVRERIAQALPVVLRNAIGGSRRWPDRRATTSSMMASNRSTGRVSNDTRPRRSAA